jgi:cytochrome c biogenesis protein
VFFLDKTNGAKRDLVARVWFFLASGKLSVIIISAISFTAGMGSVIGRQVSPDNSVGLLSRIVGASWAREVNNAVYSAGLTDIYHSWWFIGLFFLLAVNLVVCSVERFPSAWKALKDPVRPLGMDGFSSVRAGRDFVVKKSVEDALKTVCSVLGKKGFKGVVSGSEGFAQVIAEKGGYGRLGVFVTHISIPVLLIGVAIGMRFGVDGSMKLMEGESSSVVYTNKGAEFPLGFEIRCDDFDAAFYPESEYPKDYRSLLTVIDDGREVLKKEIGSDSSMTYNGFTFYQSSNYGYLPSGDALFKFRVTAPSGHNEDVRLKFNESFSVAGTDIGVKVVDFSPALGLNESNELFTFAQSMINPAVLVEITEGGRLKSRLWILKNYPDTWNTDAGIIEFKDLWGSQYTGLLVRKDPGIWMVYIGCLLMVIGLYLSLFVRHTCIWIRVMNEGDMTRLTIAASADKNARGLDRRIAGLAEALKRSGE